MISYQVARARVIETVRSLASLKASDGTSRDTPTPSENIEFLSDPSRALGRISAEDIVSDRDYPPFDRSARDGYAIRASEVREPGTRLPLAGESRAGFPFTGKFDPDCCVRIMTGAAVPAGADAVVMQEETRAEGNLVVFQQLARQEQNIIRKGTEITSGGIVLRRHTRLGYAELAIAAQVGHSRIGVIPKPRIAILSTGDEIVGVEDAPGAFQIRNSNGISLAAQVTLCGGRPVMLGNARDDISALRAQIERGLQEDALVLSGGVSVGKYDLVEPVLRELGAEFFFDAIAIRPGKPVAFGVCRRKPVFGLPGNPVSTMVTFELFVTPAIELLSGLAPQPLTLVRAKLRTPVEQKAALTHFLPARIFWPKDDSDDGPTVETLAWQGSGDIASLANGNCFIVVHQSKLKIPAGDWVGVLIRRGAL